MSLAMMSARKRKYGVLAVAALALTMLSWQPARTAPASDPADEVLSKDAVLRDADIPVLGNPKGDITVVEYFDYQCPYCKKVAPELAKVVKEDGNVRLVKKDWPILGDPSKYAARLVLAAKFQDKYLAAHEALISRIGRLTEAGVDESLAQGGVDVAKAKADYETNKDKIDALLKRNDVQAQAFGFRGTPAFIVGTFRIPTALTAEQFKMAIADARAAAKKAKPKAK
jgi:protein-disulfide isomerase